MIFSSCFNGLGKEDKIYCHDYLVSSTHNNINNTATQSRLHVFIEK